MLNKSTVCAPLYTNVNVNYFTVDLINNHNNREACKQAGCTLHRLELRFKGRSDAALGTAASLWLQEGQRERENEAEVWTERCNSSRIEASPGERIPT